MSETCEAVPDKSEKALVVSHKIYSYKWSNNNCAFKSFIFTQNSNKFQKPLKSAINYVYRLKNLQTKMIVKELLKLKFMKYSKDRWKMNTIVHWKHKIGQLWKIC